MAEAEQDDVMAGIRQVIGRVVLGVALLASIAVLAFYFGWVRAPTPEQICKHKIQLVLDTVDPNQREGADALVSQLEAKCVAAAERKVRLRGKLVYAEYAKCVMAAQTLTDAERC